jgi:hypothetical protein
VLESELDLVLAQESRHHEMPAGRTDRQPPIAHFVQDFLSKEIVGVNGKDLT